MSFYLRNAIVSNSGKVRFVPLNDIMYILLTRYVSELHESNFVSPLHYIPCGATAFSTFVCDSSGLHLPASQKEKGRASSIVISTAFSVARV